MQKRWDEIAKRWLWSGGYVYDIPPAELLSSAASGCKWCDFVVQRCGYTKQDLEDVQWVVRRTMRIRIGRMREEWILRVVVDGLETNSWGYAVSTSLGSLTTKIAIRAEIGRAHV